MPSNPTNQTKPNRKKCTFDCVKLLVSIIDFVCFFFSFSIIVSWDRKPLLADLNHMVLSTRTQSRSVERDIIHSGIVSKDRTSYWATSRSYSVGAVAEDHTQQRRAICFSIHIASYESVQLKGKWSNPEKGEAPSPTPRCSSYWKRSLWVGQLIYTYIRGVFNKSPDFLYRHLKLS